ncbi:MULTISPECIES: hypothetical protein [unclassified Paraburkholderia]|uniref:hypothetical protein n=1 Tax=unclassified Paraburkholderia TaxID=2615204 RepID=UPI002AB1E3EA|nr:MULTISPECIES: hypothetical protein [unclassified Paraburkholderia]
MKSWLRIAMGAMAMSAFGCASAAGVQQAFLVQNSGWMEPFYTDPASQFKPLVTAVANAVTAADEPAFLLAFSQSSGDNVSPRVLKAGTGAASFAAALSTLDIARKSAGGALADTDFKEAVVKTITGPFHSAPGIVWIFTNNRNSPGNDQATAARNLDFYKLLHLEPSISKTLVFPLRMSVKGKLYQAQGMMVYALAYGEPAARELDGILKAGRLSQVLTRPPARLKPLDMDAVRIVPESVANTPDVHPSLGSDQRSLVLDVDAGKVVPTIDMRASLQNLFYPYVIKHATVAATLTQGGRTVPVDVSPAAVDDLLPGERKAVQVHLTLPVEQVPSSWSPQALAAMGKQVLMPMSVNLELDDQQLALSDDFKAQLTHDFPGDPISDIFAAPSSVRSSVATVPVVLRIQYPLLPLIVAICSVLALVGGLAALALLSGRSRRYPLVVNDTHRHVVLKPFASVQIRDENGTPVGTVRRGLGRPRVTQVADGHTLSLR